MKEREKKKKEREESSSSLPPHRRMDTYSTYTHILATHFFIQKYGSKRKKSPFTLLYNFCIALLSLLALK